MNRLNTLITLAVLVLGWQACAFQREKRDVAPFDEISFSTSGELHIKQGSTQSVEVEGDEDDLERLITEVNGDRLIIKTEGWKSFNMGHIKVYVTVTELEALQISGSGEVYGEGIIHGKDIDLGISGSGDLEMYVEVEELEIRISGSGDIELAGSAQEMDLRISGSGEIDAEEMTVNVVDAHISGSGSCSVTVNEAIDASISGSGTIYYKGNPKHINSHSSGSGKVKKL